MNKKMWKNLFLYLKKLGIKSSDNEDAHLRKSILLITSLMMSIAGILWGLVYIIFGKIFAGLIPLSFSIVSIINIIILVKTLHFPRFRFFQLLFTLLLPFFLMIALGGFIKGSAVILWSLLAPIGALLCDDARNAKYWHAAFFILLIICGLLQPYVESTSNLPQIIIIIFFIINIGAVSTVSFIVLIYFVKEKELVIDLIRKNRELELAYLQQEVMLRQSEKLATLGKLSAGVAHEINNPAAAVQRGADLLHKNILTLQDAQFKLGEMKLSDRQIDFIELLNNRINEKAKLPDGLNPLKQNDLESEIEAWLENKGIHNPWEYSSTLVDIGLKKEDLFEIESEFSEKQLPSIIVSITSNFVIHSLIEEIGQGAARITEIVKALKSYSYMDKAPIQSVDIHEGLNNTLVMLRSKLKNSIVVERNYSENIPSIMAYGSELNQVWTNIIENSVDAMNNSGKIIIRTYQDGNWVVVEIQDNGKGIPEEIQAKVFDPFFTTKPPGSGTGLGLNISHNIIVQKHKGEISVKSKPGETCFQIKLHVN